MKKKTIVLGGGTSAGGKSVEDIVQPICQREDMIRGHASIQSKATPIRHTTAWLIGNIRQIFNRVNELDANGKIESNILSYLNFSCTRCSNAKY